MAFRLRTLLGGMTLVGVALFLLFAAPRIVATIGLVFAWTILAAVVTAGRGYARAFCVGAMIPVGGTILALVFVLFTWLIGGFNNLKDFKHLFEYLDEGAFTLRVWSLSGWTMTLLTGAACAAARKLLIHSPVTGEESL
jgi:hypothetical protein